MSRFQETNNRLLDQQVAIETRVARRLGGASVCVHGTQLERLLASIPSRQLFRFFDSFASFVVVVANLQVAPASQSNTQTRIALTVRTAIRKHTKQTRPAATMFT